MVINSTGVWTDELQRLSGGRGRFRVRASKGVHLVVASRPDHLGKRDHPEDREVGALRHPVEIPLDVGTTDTDWNLDLAHPAATKADIDYILDQVNRVLAGR